MAIVVARVEARAHGHIRKAPVVEVAEEVEAPITERIGVAHHLLMVFNLDLINFISLKSIQYSNYACFLNETLSLYEFKVNKGLVRLAMNMSPPVEAPQIPTLCSMPQKVLGTITVQ